MLVSGKVVSLLIASLTISFLSIFVSNPDAFGMHRNVEVYVLSEAVANPHDQKISVVNQKNFWCHLDGVDEHKFDCEIFEPTLDVEKKHSNVYQLKETQKDIKNKSLSTKDNIFKLKISSVDLKWSKALDKNIKIVAKETTANATNNVYANLKPLFASYESKKIGTTAYFIAKATVPKDNATPVSNTTCDFASKHPDIDEPINTKLVCEIFDFSKEEQPDKDKNYKQLKFEKPEKTGANPTITEVKLHKHYLIKFSEDKDKKSIEGFDYSQVILANSQSSSNKNIQVVFADIKPVVYDGVKNLFVF